MASVSTEVLAEDETLRTATVEDYQAVLDIERSVYGGVDYLPSAFTSLVEGEGVKGYLYQKQGKVVGFLSTRVLDGGQTVMTLAGRISPEYRGRGMYGRLYRRVLREVMTSTNVSHVVFTTNKSNLDKFRQRFLRAYSIVMEKKEACLEVDVDQVRKGLSSGPVSPTDHLQPLTHHHLHSMLSQPPSHLSHLFPQQRILLNWQPFRIMPDNADVIINDFRDRVFVAASRELALHGNGDNVPVTLLSCGGHFPSAQGRIYEVDLFGSGPDKEICLHLEWHLRRLADVAKEKSAMVRMFAERQLDEAVAILQRQFPVTYVDQHEQGVAVLEGVIKKSTEEICPSFQETVVGKSAD